MTEERNQFLTRAMGECWHEGQAYRGYTGPIDCTVCGKEWYPDSNNDFTTPDGFFKLWNWSKKQKWWNSFWRYTFNDPLDADDAMYLVHPERLAIAIHAFIKDKLVDEYK